MRVTFPHMGYMHIPLRAMLDYLGVEVVVPPPISKKTLTLGVKYSPEFACLPLKLNVGNFIEAFEAGADTILMAGGCGPCRFGYYAQVEHAILSELGCHFQLIVLEPPQKHVGELLTKIKKLTGKNSWRRVVEAVRFGYRLARALDEVEKTSFWVRPRELVPGSTDRALNRSVDILSRVSSPREVETAREEALQLVSSVPVDAEKEVLKVGVVGEIYTVLEPFANLHLQRLLGLLGVEVDRSIYLSEWINDHLFLGLIKNMRSSKEFCRAAQPYLCHFVGGHGQESVGGAVYYARSGMSGVIQVFPFTCMPEIVAGAVLPAVSEDFDLPIMKLIVDEHTAQTGLITRLEAFVDLLARKKELKEVSGL